MSFSEDSSWVGKKFDQSKVKFATIDDDIDFDKVISKLEIFIIKDQEIFSKDCKINGVKATIKHPDEIQEENEKWIDIRGDRFIYLKITYEDIKKCKKPITDLNFYKISRFKP